MENEEKIYPGYVLVEMIVTDDSWYVVRNTPRVTGFVGAGVTPVPLNKDEVETGMGAGEAKVYDPREKVELVTADAAYVRDYRRT